jgi:hypothetical protein
MSEPWCKDALTSLSVWCALGDSGAPPFSILSVMRRLPTPPCPRCHRIDQTEEEEQSGSSARWFVCHRCGIRYTFPRPTRRLGLSYSTRFLSAIAPRVLGERYLSDWCCPRCPDMRARQALIRIDVVERAREVQPPDVVRSAKATRRAWRRRLARLCPRETLLATPEEAQELCASGRLARTTSFEMGIEAAG